MRILWVTATAALLLTALAGCSGGKSGEQDPIEEADFEELDLAATATTGIIRGIVVDDAIRPVAGAKVALRGPDASKESVSTDVGTFGFDGLPAGTYFLSVSKVGYFDAQQSTDVVAGMAEPPIVKVQLGIDAANMPYVETLVFEGYIECSGTFVAVGFAACSAPNLAASDVCNTSGGAVCIGNTTQDNFGVFYLLSKKPTWMQSEMVWDSTQALGGKMSVMYSWDCGEDNGGFLCDHGVAGTSPLLLTADEAALEEINGGDYSKDIFVRAFNEGLDETQVGVGGGLGLTLQQRFTIFTHVFHGYQPPEDWRFTDEGTVPPPQ